MTYLEYFKTFNCVPKNVFRIIENCIYKICLHMCVCMSVCVYVYVSVFVYVYVSV